MFPQDKPKAEEFVVGVKGRMPQELRFHIWDIFFESNNKKATRSVGGDVNIEPPDGCHDSEAHIIAFIGTQTQVPIKINRVEIDVATGGFKLSPEQHLGGVWDGDRMLETIPFFKILRRDYWDYILSHHAFHFQRPQHLRGLAEELQSLSVSQPVVVSIQLYWLDCEFNKWTKAVCKLPKGSTIHLYFLRAPSSWGSLSRRVAKMKAAGQRVIFDLEEDCWEDFSDADRERYTQQTFEAVECTK